MHGHWLKDSIGPRGSENSGGGTPLIIRPSGDTYACNGNNLPIYDKQFDEVWNAFQSGTPCFVEEEILPGFTTRFLITGSQDASNAPVAIAVNSLVAIRPNGTETLVEYEDGRVCAQCVSGGGDNT